MLRVLAKPKLGNSNLINDCLYSAVGKYDCAVDDWTPAKMMMLRYDVLHVHWPENILNSKRVLGALVKFIVLFGALSWVKVFGRKVVWTAHNCQSHEQYHPRMEKCYWKLLFKFLDGIICLSESSLNDLHERHPAAKNISSTVVKHGNYIGVYKDEIVKDEARKRLGIDGNLKVVLNLGQVRSYKKVERLIDYGIKDPATCVLIAGMTKPQNYGEALQAQSKGHSNIYLHLDFVGDDELQVYLRAADLFVLPYDKITNSGSAILALSFGVAVFAPDLACFRELRDEFGEQWVYIYEGQWTNEKLAAYWELDHARCSSEVCWDGWKWEEIARDVVDFYQEII